MATQQSEAGWYKPAGRRGHSTAVVGQMLFMWAGKQDAAPRVHDSAEKRAFLSRVDVFHMQSGSWEQKTTGGTPPLGTWGYACAAVDSDIHYFGGVCGHDVCRHNSVHKLSTSSFQWKLLAPTTTEGRRPMKKSLCGMVAFKDGEDDFLFVVGGMATTASSKQLGAQYVQREEYLFTNEQHMFSVKTSQWSSPTIIGQPPPARSSFTLTPVGDNRAAMFGGRKELEHLNDLLIVKLERNFVHWTKISRPVDRSVQWPKGRVNHATTCVSGPVLVMLGGFDPSILSFDFLDPVTLSECWICDTTSKLWKKLPLSESVSERGFHSASTFQLGPHCVWLVVFGGQRQVGASVTACTAIVELVQGGDGQWSVGMVMEEVALADSRKYQDRLAEAGRNRLPVAAAAAVGNGTTTEQQLYHQKRQVQHLQETEQMLQQALQQSEQQVQQLQQQVRQLQQQVQQLQQRSSELEQEKRQLQEQLVQAHEMAEAANIQAEQQVLHQFPEQQDSGHCPATEPFIAAASVTAHPSRTLNIGDLGDVFEVVHAVTDWKRLGLQLGLHYPTLTRIKRNQHEQIDDCKMEMLSAWLKQQDDVPQKGDPSWLVLQAALRRIGEIQLADKIK